jgi:hypothetical protein
MVTGNRLQEAFGITRAGLETLNPKPAVAMVTRLRDYKKRSLESRLATSFAKGVSVE